MNLECEVLSVLLKYKKIIIIIIACIYMHAIACWKVDIGRCWYCQQGWRVQCHVRPQQGWPRSLDFCLFQSATPGGFLCWSALGHSNTCGPCSWPWIQLCPVAEWCQTARTSFLSQWQCWPFCQQMWRSVTLARSVCLHEGNTKMMCIGNLR